MVSIRFSCGLFMVDEDSTETKVTHYLSPKWLLLGDCCGGIQILKVQTESIP